jgi:hypothetical protein
VVNREEAEMAGHVQSLAVQVYGESVAELERKALAEGQLFFGPDAKVEISSPDYQITAYPGAAPGSHYGAYIYVRQSPVLSMPDEVQKAIRSLQPNTPPQSDTAT